MDQTLTPPGPQHRLDWRGRKILEGQHEAVPQLCLSEVCGVDGDPRIWGDPKIKLKECINEMSMGSFRGICRMHALHVGTITAIVKRCDWSDMRSGVNPLEP